MNETSNTTTHEAGETEGPFLASVPGRLATVTGGLSLLGMGALAILGPGPHAVFIVGAVPLTCIILGIFAVGLSTLRSDQEPTVEILISFPILAGISLGALLSAPAAGGVVGAVLAAVGLLVVVAGARGSAFKAHESRAQAPAPVQHG